MISQLFALPLRALVVAAAIPTPQAQGAVLPLYDNRPVVARRAGAHVTGHAVFSPNLVLRSATEPAGR